MGWRDRLGSWIAGRNTAMGPSGVADKAIKELGYQGPSYPAPATETEKRIAQPDALFGPVAANAGPNRTRVSSYPATNLNPGMIRDIHEEADRGIVYRWGDFGYQILWRDGHIYASHRERASAVAGNEFRILAANESDLARSLRDYMEAVVDGIDRFDASCYQLLDAPMIGWSCLEQIYETGKVRFRGPKGDGITLRGAFPRRLEWVHPKHFWFDFALDYPLLDLASDGKVRLEKHKFIYHEATGNGIVATRGWMRPASWLTYFKSCGIRDLSVFLHLFGIPNVWAKIDRARWQDPEFRSVLEAALRDCGQGNPSVLFKDMDITIQPAQAAGGNGQVHLPYIGFMNAEISKVIKGETLTSEAGMSGNSYALSQTHQDTFFGTVTMDNRGLSNTLRAQAFRSWIEVNAGPLCNAFGVDLDELLANRPICTHAIEEGISPVQKAMILDTAVNKLRLTVGQSEGYRRLGINPPKPGEPTLQGAPVTIPADGKTVGTVDAAGGVENPKPESPPSGAAPANGTGRGTWPT